VEDGSTPMRAPLFPGQEDEKVTLGDRARALATAIERSKEFARWQIEEREKKLAAFGAFLGVLDTMTGLPTSQIYKTVLALWKGDNDYLQYLKTIAAIMPRGGQVASTIVEAIEYTEKARQIAGVVVETTKHGLSTDALLAEAKAQVMARAKGSVVLNTASRFALERADKQLSFFKENAEIEKVTAMLGETELMRGAIPSIPKM